jgi:omega-6 fatty acid desaturase (delta-12 desaturase)
VATRTKRLRNSVTPIPTGDLKRQLAEYKRPHLGRSLFELIFTAACLAVLWVAAWGLTQVHLWWAAMALVVPAALFLVRLFMIQHDCGHGSFFASKHANDWVGRSIGVLTLTPYDYWRRTHAMHHATSANLDRRAGLGEIAMLTVDEYLALPRLKRLGYRLYRHPLVLFGLGPFFTFFLQQRLPVGLMKDWRQWLSTMGTTLSAVVLLGLLVWLGGWAPVLTIVCGTMLLGATIGVFLFFVQHQFEGVVWLSQKQWNREDAALLGSSHLDLPQPLKWFTANIGIHHVHHLNSLIPSYRLPEVLSDHPTLRQVSRINLFQAFRFVNLGLWDEGAQQLISFRRLRQARAAA